MRWFSLKRAFNNTFALGVVVGWDPDDHTAAFAIQLGFWLLVIGPHVWN